MQIIYDWCGGRSTFFALALLFFGTALAFAHKLDMSYVGLATALQGFVVARAISEDHCVPPPKV